MDDNKLMNVAIEVMRTVGPRAFLRRQPKGLLLWATTEAVLAERISEQEAYDAVAWIAAERAREELSNALVRADKQRRRYDNE